MENLLRQNEGSIINYLQKSTEVAKWGTPSCSRPQPATTMASVTVDPIDWSHPSPSWSVLPEFLVHSINHCSLSVNRPCNRSMRCNHLAYAATQGKSTSRVLI